MLKKCLVLVVLGLASGSALAVPTIFYELSQVGGSQWRYDYTVFNDSAFVIDEFTVWFDYNQYSNLQLQSTPAVSAGWDEWITQPNKDFSANGLYDPFAFAGNEIQPGQTQSGFSVSFDWSGTSLPGSQLFDIVDVDDYSTPLFTGQTTLTVPSVVPVPSAGLLAVIGLVSAFSYMKKGKGV